MKSPKSSFTSLAHGRHLLAIPGPSVLPDRVLQAMHRPSANIYTGALLDMVDTILSDLKSVARTAHQVAIYISNGHGAWEAALANVVAPGDKVLVPATGTFGIGWGEMAEKLGADTDVVDFGKSGTFDLEKIRDVLALDTKHKIKAILATHVDTSSSVRNDLSALRGVLDQLGHPALLMADCIASLGCERFEMDDWGVDVAVAASQKGLMVPPGMGFVFFNPRAAEARARLSQVSPYWDWVPRASPDFFYELFCGTAPTHHLYGLREALNILVHEEGVEAAWRRHEIVARAVWAAMEHWGAEGPLRLNITDENLRSHAVTSAHIGSPDGTALRDWLSTNMGVTLGIGLGMAAPGDPAWHGYFRIGHMGHVNAQMILGTLGTIEAGLAHLGIVHQPGGVAAAARICAQV